MSWSDAIQAGSVIVAIATWFFTHLKDKRREKVQKTVELLMPFTTSDRLTAGNVLLARMMTSATPPKLGDSPDVDDNIVDLLDYYEFLCELLERDVLDRNTALQLRGRLLGKIYNFLGAYIETLREKHGRGVYSAIAKVVSTYRLDTDAPLLAGA